MNRLLVLFPCRENHAARIAHRVRSARQSLAAPGVAFIWLATGLAVLHPHYRAQGVKYLEPLGLPPWVMLAACIGEVLLGLRVLFGRAATWLVLVQAAAIVAFTVILGVTQPPLPVGSVRRAGEKSAAALDDRHDVAAGARRLDAARLVAVALRHGADLVHGRIVAMRVDAGQGVARRDRGAARSVR